jgi:hypothetical protein
VRRYLQLEHYKRKTLRLPHGVDDADPGHDTASIARGLDANLPLALNRPSGDEPSAAADIPLSELSSHGNNTGAASPGGDRATSEGVPVPFNNNSLGPGIQHACASSQNVVSGPLVPSTWILLCAKRYWGLPHEQIEILPNTNDTEVFREFRSHYRQLRGLSYWLGTDKFYYCHAAKFSRFDVRQIAHDCNQMPNNQDYIFLPRPPSNPYTRPIPVREWEHKFHKDCSYTSREVLNLLPKRKLRYELDTCLKREEVWGLYVVYRTSTRMMLAWTFIIILPSAAVLLSWAILNKRMDLQNASIPMTITLAGLPVLWAVSGRQFKGEIEVA